MRAGMRPRVPMVRWCPGLRRTGPSTDSPPLRPRLRTIRAARAIGLPRAPSDEDITPSDTYNDPPLNFQGPITRAHARQLNLEVSSFLSNSLYNFENRLLPNDYVLLRNHGEDKETHRGRLGGVEEQLGRPTTAGGPVQLESESASTSRTSEQ